MIEMVRAVWRQGTRHTLYTGLNVFGLGLGIAVFVLMALIVRYQESYNGSYPRMGDVYRVDEVFRLPGNAPFEEPQASLVGEPFIKQDFAGVSDIVRVWNKSVQLRLGGAVRQEKVSAADPNLFSFFKVPVIAGDRDHALDQADTIAVPSSIARKYFGTEQAIGRVLTDLATGTSFTVALVYADPPPNTEVEFGIVRRVLKTEEGIGVSEWGTMNATWWARVPDARAVAGIQAGLNGYATRHPGGMSVQDTVRYYGRTGLKLVPFGATHFYDHTIGAGGEDWRLVEILAMVGLAALAISCVNYINLATARAGERAREVAMRKVLGATRGALVRQFIAEAVGLSLLAGVFGLALAELSLRFVNAQGGWAVSFDLGFAAPVAFGIAVLAGVLAGVYPAFLLSGYRPAAVLASSKMPSGGRLAGRLRNGLVLAQFAFATGLAICALIMGQQAEYVHGLAQRANPDEIVVVDPPKKLGGEVALREAFAAIPGTVAVGRSNLIPHRFWYNRSYGREGMPAKILFSVGNVTPDFQALYGVKMLAGRWFDPARAMDFSGASEDGNSEGYARTGEGIVITARAAEKLGFHQPRDAVGKIVHGNQGESNFVIIGVSDNVRLTGPAERPQPIVFFGLHVEHRQDPNFSWQIRIHGASAQAARALVQAAWRRVRPDDAFSAQIVSDIVATDYRESGNLSRLFGAGAGVSILIACLGLFGLSVFTLARRAHEIGIRKVLGAGQKDILVLLGREFLGPVVMASAIAWPVSLLLMWRWLSGYTERVGLGPGPFVLVTAIALVIAGGTVLVQALKASRQPPSMALRR